MDISNLTDSAALFRDKKVYIHGHPYVYWEDPALLDKVLEKYGATIQDEIDDQTDLVVWCNMFTCSRPNFDDDRILDELSLYETLALQGERGSKFRIFPKRNLDRDERLLFEEISYYKWEAQFNWFRYPSFEMKSIFLHGSFHKYRKTIARMLELQGGFLDDELREDTDFVVIGRNFKMQFLDQVEQISKERRLIIMDEFTFYKQFEVIESINDGNPPPANTPFEKFDRTKVYANALDHAYKLRQQGRFDKSIKEYEKLLPIDSIKYKVIEELSWVYEKMKDEEKALEMIALLLEKPALSEDGVSYYTSRMKILRNRMEKRNPHPKKVAAKKNNK